jgi:hypothetical protein
LETEQGQTDPGVQLALYFARVAPTVTSAYGILGNENLLEVVQTIFGLAPTTNSSQIDAEAAAVTKLLPLSDLQNPKQLQNLVERFTASYDEDYGPGGSKSDDALTVASGNEQSSVSAPTTVLGDIVSANEAALAQSEPTTAITASLLASWALGR